MKTLAIEIPEEILFELKIPRQRWGIELRKELALQLYRENLLPFGHARRLAGMTVEYLSPYQTSAALSNSPRTPKRATPASG